MSTLERSIEAAKTLQSDVYKRRSKWLEASRIIDQCLADFTQRWKEAGGEHFYIERRTNQHSPFGLKTINSNCVAMHCGNRLTGVAQIDSNKKSFSQEIEKSGHLLFSQMPDGYILIIATPPTSELKKLPFDRIIINISLCPSDLKYTVVEKAIVHYLWLQRIAGYEGRPNFLDRMKLFRFWMTEWRHSNDWKAWIFFWTAVATLIFAIISAAANLKKLFGD